MKNVNTQVTSTTPSLIEAGHYYLAKGPTLWSVVGMEIASKIKGTHDQMIIFLDDVHPLKDVQELEKDLPLISGFNPQIDHTVLESDMVNPALTFLESLKQLPKKKVKQNKQGKWFYEGFPLTTADGYPLCVLLDAGLSATKKSMGFNHIVNVLPYFYEKEQSNLKKMVNKIIPGLEISTVLFDLDGSYQVLCPEPAQPLATEQTSTNQFTL